MSVECISDSSTTFEAYEDARPHLRRFVSQIDRSMSNKGSDASQKHKSLTHGSGRSREMHTRITSDVEYLSSVPPESAKTEKLPLETQQVYAELQEISNKLKTELHLLHERETALKEKEALMTETQSSLDRLIAVDVQSKLAEKQQEFQQLKDQLHEKTKENKRIKENFDTLKMANDTLNKELKSLQSAHDKLERQHCSLQARITNLQRINESAGRVAQERLEIDAAQTKSTASAKVTAPTASKPKLKSAKHPCSAVYDMLMSLLEWVCEASLSQSADTDESPIHVQARCLKILPSLLEVMRDMPSRDSATNLVYLQFVYWSVLQLDAVTHGQQKHVLPSTMRRLGEEIYGSRSTIQHKTSSSDVGSVCDQSLDGQFFRSTDIHVRFLSTLIILRTINQADQLAHAFEALQNDLQTEHGRQLFLHYRALPVILSFIRPANKLLTNSAIDVMLEMCVESSTLSAFVDMCSQPGIAAECFQKMELLWRVSTSEPNLLEKVSIMLQKLSKIRSNRKFFDMYGISTICPEILRAHGSKSPFLSLNIKSILQNINAPR